MALGASPSSGLGHPVDQAAQVVAVDCNGADRGPAEVAAGASLAAARGVRVVLFGPAAELGELPAGIEVVDAPVSIAKSDDPVSAARATPGASIVQATSALPTRAGRSCAS